MDKGLQKACIEEVNIAKSRALPHKSSNYLEHVTHNIPFTIATESRSYPRGTTNHKNV